MKNLKKIAAAALALSMMTLFVGCGGDQSWSYKTDAMSLTAGTYIYNMLNSYYEAYDLVESPDEAKSVMNVNITDSDGNSTTVEQYAYDGAERECLKMLAVEELMKEYNLELDQNEYDAAVSYASQFWANIKDQFEEYGISQESFNYCYAEYNVKYGQVFEALYGKDGEKYVDDEELTKYFKDNYTGYAYFGKSVATTNDAGESVAMSDEEIKEITDALQGCVDALNNGTEYADVVAEYAENDGLTSDPTYSGAVKLDDCNLDEAIVDALAKLDEGKAALVKTGEDETAYYYVVYRPVTDTIIDFLENDSDTDTDAAAESNDTAEAESETAVTETEDTASASVYIYDLKSGYSHYTLLDEYKGEDFKDYLKEKGSSLDCAKNSDVIGRYKPTMFEKSSN